MRNKNIDKVLIAVAGAVLWAAFMIIPAQAAEHTKDSLDKVQEGLKDKKVILLDVREQSEWDDGHLRDAVLLPLSKLRKLDADAVARDLPKDKVIYIHCASGVRVLPAADILIKHGYDARPLKPGYEKLLKAGFPKAEK